MTRKLPDRQTLIIAACIVLFGAVFGAKVFLLDYRPDQVIPLEGWRVSISMEATGQGRDLTIRHFLPPVEPGQGIEQESFSGDYSKHSVGTVQENRSVTFSFKRPLGKVDATASFLCLPRRIAYVLPDSLAMPLNTPADMQDELEAEPLIQKDAPEIAALARELGLYDSPDAVDVLRRVFDYCFRRIEKAKFSGETDAVLTFRLGEASCNGKSRLMVALCRHMGIPARLVGGLILQGGDKKTTHQWVEANVNGKWVPFCPLNGHFAEKPASYVAFYRGDLGFFRHTKDIRFEYSFGLEPVLIPRDRGFAGRHAFLDITSIWQLLEQSGIPLSALGILLVIPVGALVTILFRNVLGVHTYGTFLPALIAYAFQGTGLAWGIAIFAVVIAGGAGLDLVVSRLKLLHTPRLTVLMLFVVAALLAFGVWGLRNGHPHAAKALFFPLAVHTITIERFFVVTQERGLRKSFTMLGWSMLVAAFCYMVMSSLALQMIVVFFPETYLLILAAAIYLGRWTGLRVSELGRFRGLLGGSGAAA